MTLPDDPAILVSYINTQLRDFYPSLSELCAALCIDEEALVGKLLAADFTYDEKENRFI